MFRRRNKKEEVVRNPRIERQKQAAFHYSSNRSPAERSGREVSGELDAEGRPIKLPSRRIRNFILAAASVVLILGASFFSVLSGSPVVEIPKEQKLLRPADDYANEASSANKGILSFSKIFINRQRIEDNLRAKYPEINSVNVSTPIFSRRVVLKLNLSSPAAILTADGNSYALNSSGLAIFRLTAVPPGSSKVPQIKDESGASIEVGKPALTSRQVSFITEVKHQSDAKELPIKSIILTAGGGELNVYHEGVEFFAKYNLYEDARTSFGTFYATKEFMDEKNEVPAEYIDVRIPERAYIK